jgi:hypothetical protein
MSSESDAAYELQDAVRELDSAKAEIFFVGNSGWVVWGNPTPPKHLMVFSRHPIIKAEGAQLLAERLNAAISSARSAYIAECEARVRKAKEALVKSL